MKKYIASAISFFALSAAMAQQPISSSHMTSSGVSTNSMADNRILVDFAPMFTQGFGLSYERTITPAVTLGIHGMTAKYNMDSVDGDSKVTMYGVHARYFLNSKSYSGGVYLLGGVQVAEATTEAQFSGTDKGTKTESAVGPLLGAGYQLGLNLPIFGVTPVVDLGLTYATGYAVQTSASSYGFGPTNVAESTPKEALFLEAAFGFRF